MKITIALLTTLSLSTWHSDAQTTSSSLRKKEVQKKEETQAPLRLMTSFCGCNECTVDIWNRVTPSFYTDDTYTCGDRITYLTEMADPLKTPDEACRQVAGVEFPTICGPFCNPDRCDGKHETLEVTPAPTHAPLEGNLPLTETTPLYCYPNVAQRERWANLWGKYTVETKESPALCGPGDNRFLRQNVNVDKALDGTDDQLVLKFQRQGEVWSASEVRVLLPWEEMPYTYGKYSFHIQSIRHMAPDGRLLNSHLPPSLVLGLFTWDATERYELKENYNHEVDIEISRWNRPVNFDANFLIQPPELPQWHRFYSGGSAGTFNQTGLWEFDWLPTNVSWFTDAASGQNHTYSTSDAALFGIPDRIQCLPANMEVRINLWSILGTNTPTEMGPNDVVEVIIDKFDYVPSSVTHGKDGESCSKHCQCAPTSSCNMGRCAPGEMNEGPNSQPTISPQFTSPPSLSLAPSTKAPSGSPSLSSAPVNEAPSGSTPSTPTAQSLPGSRQCRSHEACRHLTGMCCPTRDNVMLDCCDSVTETSRPTVYPSEIPSSLPTRPEVFKPPSSIPKSTSPSYQPTRGHSAAPSSLRTMSAPPTGVPTQDPSLGPTTSEPDAGVSSLCAAHTACSHLAGECCPTLDGISLSCCDSRTVELPPTPTPIESELCSAHPRCVDLIGNCCPTPSGMVLDCCFH